MPISEALTWALPSSFAALLGFFSIVINWNRHQKCREFHPELVPNCLLTRHPLLFICGPRTLFYFGRHWNQIPSYLQEHGYEVSVLEVPGKKISFRRQYIKEFIDQLPNSKFHVIADASSNEEIEWLADWAPENVVSLNLCTVPEQANHPQTDRDENNWRPKSMAITPWTLTPESPVRSVSIHRWWLLAHNTCLRGSRSLAPEVVAHPKLSESDQVHRFYLDIAISLAESDATCSH